MLKDCPQPHLSVSLGFLNTNVDENSSFKETSSFITYPENKRYINFTGASYDLALISLKDPLTDINAINISNAIPNLHDEIYDENGEKKGEYFLHPNKLTGEMMI